MGCSVNQTAQGYSIQVKESQLATSALLGFIHMATLAPQERQMIAEAIDGAKLDIVVDWNKYAANSDQSVEVYYRGNGRESDAFAKILASRKIGAYLTFDDKDRIKKIVWKDIDEKLTQGIETAHILLKGASIDRVQTAANTPLAEAFRIKGGDFSYTLESNGSKELGFSYSGLHCEIDKTNAYLGKQTCGFPLITIEGGTGDEMFAMVLKESSLLYDVQAHHHKIKADTLFKIPQISVTIKERGSEVAIGLKDFIIEGFSDNVDEGVVKGFYEISTNPSKDLNQTLSTMITLVGDLFGGGMAFDYKGSIASIDGTVNSSKGLITFNLRDLRGEDNASFGKTINYQKTFSIQSILVKKDKAATPLFALQGLRFGFALKELYNFLPEFMQFALLAAEKQQAGQAITPEEEAKMIAIGHTITNHGFGVSFAPVGIENLTIEEGNGKQMHYGKIDLQIDATLAKNSAKLDNPMAAMLLLGFLQAEGKLILSKADLDQMSQQFPPQIMAMVMIYANYEGDKAIFELKFKQGHLMLNDKPVM